MGYERYEATFTVARPMFIAGADQSKAELRVPSIKGMLRFWWRAVALARLGTWQEVKKEEATVFGSADQGIGQSKVLLSIIRKDLEYWEPEEWRPSDWRTYVGYGLHEGDRKAIEEGSAFTLSIVFKPSFSDHKAKEEVLLALKTLGLIGGMGSNSRNGWGSLAITSLKKEKGNVGSGKSLLGKFDEEIEALRKIGDNYASLPPYTAFSKKTQIAVGRDASKSSAAEAHKVIGSAYKNFVKGFSGDEKGKREIFGLPRWDYDTDRRRASPVFIHIHPVDGKYIPVASLLPASFYKNKIEESRYEPAKEFLRIVKEELK